VVDEYPEQTEAVKVAKEKLSVLLKARTVIRKGDIEFALRKIGVGIETGLGAISPDGRYLTYVDWNTGDLAVQEMATGKKRHLTDKGSWNKSGAQAFCSRWSPDGKQIAYDWWDWDREPNFVGIRIVSLDGKESQTLYQVTNPEKGVTITYGWSPDGKYLAYISIRDSLGPKSSTQSVLCIRSLDTGEERELFPDLPDFWNLKWSPDSRYILCIAVDELLPKKWTDQ